MAKKRKLQQKRGDTIKLIVKSNELVEAKYMFDIWETRFFHALVVMINKNDEDDKTYRVWFKEVKKLYNIKTNQSYNLLREAARSLNRKPVYIGWRNDQFKRGREYNLFEFVDYLEAGQKGNGVEKQEYVDIRIHSQMRPFLLHVKKNFDPALTRYTSYDLRNIEKLQPYGTRIYELLKQFEYKGFRVLNIEELKDRFLITDEYKRFSTLFQRVIMPSIKAINKHTDITIPIDKIVKIKGGRKVIALKCIIESKTRQEIAVLRNDTIQGDLFELQEPQVSDEESGIVETEADLLFREFEDPVVKSFGVTPSVFIRLLNTGKYSQQDLKQSIRVTRRAKVNNEIKKSLSGFFLKALKDGYTDEKEEAIKIKKNLTSEFNKLQKELNRIKDDFALAINERIRNITAKDEAITLKAIKLIKSNPITEALILDKERAIGRILKIEDYREDERLRTMVINNIIQQQQEYFADILEDYQPKIKKLELQTKMIKDRLD